MQKPLTPKMELLHKNVPLIYHLMDKYGVSKKQRMGEMGQFIWEKLCTYIEAYDSKKGTLGTWAGWQIWAAKKNFLEKHYKHKNQCVPSKEIFDVTSREHAEDRQDYLAYDKIRDTMDRVLVSTNGGVSHREVIRLCWEEGVTYRNAAKQLKVSKARIGHIIDASKLRLQYELKDMDEDQYETRRIPGTKTNIR